MFSGVGTFHSSYRTSEDGTRGKRPAQRGRGGGSAAKARCSTVRTRGSRLLPSFYSSSQILTKERYSGIAHGRPTVVEHTGRQAKRSCAGTTRCPECGGRYVELEYFRLRHVNRCRCESCGAAWIPVDPRRQQRKVPGCEVRREGTDGEDAERVSMRFRSPEFAGRK